MKHQEHAVPSSQQTTKGHSTIHCGVDNCAYHNPQNYCSLNSIQVGACTNEVTMPANTKCASFQMENQGCCH